MARLKMLEPNISDLNEPTIPDATVPAGKLRATVRKRLARRRR
jgi:hypothetical protein